MIRAILPVLLLALAAGSAAAADEPAATAPDADAGRVRPSALAGTWYPADAGSLAATVDDLVSAAQPPAPDGTLRALVVPHAGYTYSGATAADAFALLRGASPGRVVVLAPAHRGGFDGLSIADVDAYETPLGQVPLDREAVARLRASPLVQADPAAHRQEHAIEIELPFLQRTLAPGWRLVPVLVGGLDGDADRRAAALIRPLLDDDTLLVVSSDFTHYGPRFGYVPFPADTQLPARIRALDDGAVSRIKARDAGGLRDYQAETGITVCGLQPLRVLLDLLPAEARVQRLAYATSGELTGDWSNSVSYVALAVTAPRPLADTVPRPADAPSSEPPLDKAALQRLHQLALLGIRRAVLGADRVPDDMIRSAIADLPPALEQPAGAFVTLWKEGQLRGCVGHVPDDLPVYASVLRSGANAARKDPRFLPVRPDELEHLDVEVSVLTPPRPIQSPEEIRLGEHGITLEKDGHYGLYLPEVAETMGWDLETTLSQLAIKAGLPADAWRDGASFEVFTSTAYQAPYPAPDDQVGTPGKGPSGPKLLMKRP